MNASAQIVRNLMARSRTHCCRPPIVMIMRIGRRRAGESRG